MTFPIVQVLLLKSYPIATSRRESRFGHSVEVTGLEYAVPHLHAAILSGHLGSDPIQHY